MKIILATIVHIVGISTLLTGAETHQATMEVLKTGHLRIQVTINGNGPYPLIFDTGAPVNLLSNKIGKEANIKRKPGRSGLTFMGPIGEADIASLEWGGAKVEHVPTMIMDHPTVKTLADHLGPIEGIVGFPFFAKFAITINYQKKMVTLEPNGFIPGDLMKNSMGLIFKKQNQPIQPPSEQVIGLIFSPQIDRKTHGLVIEKILAGSLAEKSGFKTGDTLVAINQRWVNDHAGLFQVLGEQWVKGSVIVEISRENVLQELKLNKPVGATP
jgi:hypothetical protein